MRAPLDFGEITQKLETPDSGVLERRRTAFGDPRRNFVDADLSTLLEVALSVSKAESSVVVERHRWRQYTGGAG